MVQFELRTLVTRRFWEPITRSLFLMATGAYVLAIYVAANEPIPSADQLIDKVRIVWWGLFFLWIATTPRRKQGQEVGEPTPARSGTGVVLACGLGASFFLAQGAIWPEGFILPAAVLLATTVIATLVYRFASSHADEIGEARFQTVSTPRQVD